MVVWFLTGEKHFESLIVGSDDEPFLPKEGQTCIWLVLVRADVTNGSNIVDFGLAVRDPQQLEDCSQAAFWVGFTTWSQCLDGVGGGGIPIFW